MIGCKVFNTSINSVIDKTQTGFQPKARKSDHMCVFRTLIERYLCKGSKGCACFVDFVKKRLTV